MMSIKIRLEVFASIKLMVGETLSLGILTPDDKVIGASHDYFNYKLALLSCRCGGSSILYANPTSPDNKSIT